MICLACLALNSCVTKKQVEAATWLNNFNTIPKEYCLPGGPMYNLAYYRRLDDGKLQILRLCAGQNHLMFSVWHEDYKKIMDALK
jgi:hypothetical protein